MDKSFTKQPTIKGTIKPPKVLRHRILFSSIYIFSNPRKIKVKNPNNVFGITNQRDSLFRFLTTGNHLNQYHKSNSIRLRATASSIILMKSTHLPFLKLITSIMIDSVSEKSNTFHKKLLKTFKNIRKCQMDCNSFHLINDFRVFPQLKWLKLEDVTKLNYDMQSIQYMSGLTILDLSFKNQQKTSKLPYRFPLPLGLTTLKIKFQDCAFGLQDMTILCFQINHLVKLQQLQLLFENTELLPGAFGIVTPSKNMIPQYFLKAIDIQIKTTKALPSLTFNEICQWIPQFPDCQYFKLHLERGELIEEKQMKAFIKTLQSLKHLSMVDLGLRGFALIKDSPLKSIYESLGKLKNVFSIALQMSNWLQITDGGLGKISKILNNTKNLLQLELNFQEMQTLGTKAIKSISDCLLKDNHFKKLVQLDFNFGSCPSLKDECLWTFGKCFGNLISLTVLKLNFEKNEQLTDEGLKGLSKGLISAKNLDSISIDFSYCHTISKAGFNFIFDSTCYLHDLKEITLDFFACATLQQDQISMHSYLLCLPNVRDLNLSMGVFRYNLHPYIICKNAKIKSKKNKIEIKQEDLF